MESNCNSVSMKENGYIGGELLVNVRARQMIFARWTCNEKRNRKLEFNGKNFRWWSKRQAKRAAHGWNSMYTGGQNKSWTTAANY